MGNPNLGLPIAWSYYYHLQTPASKARVHQFEFSECMNFGFSRMPSTWHNLHQGLTSSGLLPPANMWSNIFFTTCLLLCTAPDCTWLHLTAPNRALLHFKGFLLEMVTPSKSSSEPLWAPDQHPMCLCGCTCTPSIHQVIPLASSPHTQFHSHSPPYCTILHFFDSDWVITPNHSMCDELVTLFCIPAALFSEIVD
jgi:hypothetical protein